ncbi:MAG: two-component system sensor histidine kinase NtrB, partial [Deferrisomatales bacterium]
DPGRVLGHPQVLGRRAEELGMPCRYGGGPREGAGVPCGHRDLSVRADGPEARILLWSCEAVAGGPGRPAGCRIRCLDAGPRPPLDVQIFRAKHEIEAVFDSVTDPTALVDEGLRVLRANRALGRLTGRAFDELLGRPLPEVLGGLSGEALTARVRDALSTGSPARDEVRAPGGTIFKVRVFPLMSRGRAQQAVVRLHDATAERRTEERLLQAERMAGVGQLATGIAHEINNPMGFIAWNLSRLEEYLATLDRALAPALGWAERARAGEAGAAAELAACAARWDRAELAFLLDDARSLVGECRTGALRVQEIIRGLRAYAHPGTAEWEAADLNQCLDGAIRMVWNELKYTCELQRDYARLPPLRCRPQRLAQVFLNLLVNAAQAMPQGGVVTVGTRAEGGRLRAWVSDTGVGIPAEHLRRIFDPFFTTKPVGQGTGLGLHIALEIVREHGGEIEVTSEPHRGTTVALSLPEQPPAAGPANGSAAPGIGEKPTEQPPWATP